MRNLFDDDQSAWVATLPRPAGSLAVRVPPRPYQWEAVEAFDAAYAAGERGMLYRLATGLGKTYTAALTSERWLEADPDRRRVMVVCYEREHVKQFRDELEGFLPQLRVGLEMGTDGTVAPDFIPPITVSSRQSLYVDGEGRSRLYKFSVELYDWLVIVEECHGWAYYLKSCTHIVDWFDQNPASCRVGLTATPQRGDGVSLGRLFGHVCVEMPLGVAIEEGYLVPFRQSFVVVEGLDFKNLKEVAGDFDDAELDQILSERESLMAMVGPLLDLSGGRRTIVFCPGVACAKAVARTINAEIDLRRLPNGRAESMDGSTPDAIREDIKTRHKAGEFQYLVVCNLCRAGYDDKGISCVAVFRPTKSRVLAEQMKGRGVRTLRGTIDGLATAEERRAAIAASPKPDCLVIDLVGVSGMPEVASTAHLIASGEPDEVIERANRRAKDKADETVEEAIRKAKAEIEAEREKLKREREERERREAADALRRAKLEAEVRYSAREVSGPADGGSYTDVDRMVLRATDAQVAILVNKWHVPAETARGYSRRQASAVLESYRKRGVPAASPARPSPVDSSSPPTDRQKAVLRRHRRPIPSTFGEAVNLIKDINRELAS